MNRLRGLALACVAVAAAQPALATRNLEGLVLNSFLQRCLAPLQAGDAPGIADLTLPEGSGEIGKPGPEILIENVDGPMSLRIQTLPAGLTSCAIQLNLPQGFQLDQVNAGLADHLRKQGYQPVAACPTDAITNLHAYEGPVAAGGGRRIGVLSFVITLGGTLPDELSLIAAESDKALVADPNCPLENGEAQ